MCYRYDVVLRIMSVSDLWGKGIHNFLTHLANEVLTQMCQSLQSTHTSHWSMPLAICRSRHSVSKLVKVVLVVALWIFLSMDPVAFALINAETLTRKFGGPAERGGACFTLRSWFLLSKTEWSECERWSLFSFFKPSLISAWVITASLSGKSRRTQALCL